MAEPGVHALGDVPELPPALGGFGVKRRRLSICAAGFSELGPGRGQSMLVERGGGDGFETRDQPLGERQVVERGPDAEQGRKA